MRGMRRASSMVVIAVIAGVLNQPVGAQAPPPDTAASPEVQASLAAAAPWEPVRVVVTMVEQADLNRAALSDGEPPADREERVKAVVQELKATADTSQAGIKDELDAAVAEGAAIGFDQLWIINGLVVEATPRVVQSLAARPDVASVELDELVAIAPAGAPTGPPEPNIDLVNAPDLWALGHTGEGIVIASLDTGVDAGHPDLAANWRGGTNSWFDPYGEHPTTPADPDGHGTFTMGLMVGRDASGTTIGMAPDAQWIAAKIFDDQGNATLAAIHQAFQWILDPDGDPASADAPHVVNNSWSFTSLGCELEFQPDLQALRAAGIVPVFAAGNSGPGGATSLSPGNNPEAFAVGATSLADTLSSLSSRGPSSCSGDPVSPDLVAPGVDITSSYSFGGYASRSGTSASAPHVGGGLALLLSAYPDLTVEDQEAALVAGAIDLGAAGSDDLFGHGRLDVLGSYQALAPEAPDVFFTPKNEFEVPAFEAGHDDVVRYDGAGFELFFDGSDVGIGGAHISGLAVFDNGLWLSFADPVTVPGINGTVRQSDVVRFDAAAFGPSTAGIFSKVFDGSDHGLTGGKRKIDGLAVGPDGQLLVSIKGDAVVAGIAAKNDDVLAFTPDHPGFYDGPGVWSRHFDSSALGFDRPNNVVGVAVAPDGVYLSTNRSFEVDDSAGSTLAGTSSDVFGCTPVTFDPVDDCLLDSGLLFDGSQAGVDDSLAAIDVGRGGSIPESEPIFYLSVSDGSSIGATPSDVLVWDGYDLEIWFDGSAAGVSAAIGALAMIDADSLLVSFRDPSAVPGLGTVDDSDLVRFDGTAFGDGTTAGTFSLFLEGTAHNLTRAGEEIDAVEYLAGGELLLSTTGVLRTGGYRAEDEDVSRFLPIATGDYSAGTWDLYLDGSTVGLATSGGEDVDAVSVGSSLALSTKGRFEITDLSGKKGDVFGCDPPGAPPIVACVSPKLLLNGSRLGLGRTNVVAIDRPPLLP